MRFKIEKANHEIGDIIFGECITGFGKSWTTEVTDNSHFRGQLWQGCTICKEEPVYMPSELCENCINRNYGSETKEFCYAYCEPIEN